jgi:hypothetical protein
VSLAFRYILVNFYTSKNTREHTLRENALIFLRLYLSQGKHTKNTRDGKYTKNTRENSTIF